MPTDPAVYIDSMGHLWSADREALHIFAARAGLKREWFQDRPRLYHYDVTTRFMRGLAVMNGAHKVSPRRLVALIHEAGADDAD